MQSWQEQLGVVFKLLFAFVLNVESYQEREYWAQKQGQKKLCEENAERTANGEKPKRTKFENDKQVS